MNIKSKRIEYLTEMLGQFQSKDMRTEEGKTVRDSIVELISSFLDKYEEAELSEDEESEVVIPLLFVIGERVRPKQETEFAESMDYTGLHIIYMDTYMKISKADADRSFGEIKGNLNAIGEVIDIENSELAKKKLNETFEYFEKYYIDEIGTFRNRIDKFTEWVGEQPEIAKVLKKNN